MSDLLRDAASVLDLGILEGSLYTEKRDQLTAELLLVIDDNCGADGRLDDHLYEIHRAAEALAKRILGGYDE